MGILFFGAVLLTLPAAARSGESTPFINSLFTATSATCVTGLVVYDTWTHWTPFGQAVILVLIQTGGLGFMTIISLFSVFMKRKISLHERRLLMQSVGTMRVGGIIRLIKRIALGTLFFEGIGAALLAIRFCPDMGFARGLWYSVFHSVSAFCNAGFDLMGYREQFSSLTFFRDDPLVNLTITALVIIGGLGFLVWEDLITQIRHRHHLQLHTKIVLSATGLLLLFSFVSFFFLEADHSMAGLSLGDRLLASWFQAVTPRTAGFNTVDLAALSPGGDLTTIFLMFIGGSPGSTAGGIKTTTLAVMFLCTAASARQQNGCTIFKRRLTGDLMQQASAIVTIYLIAVIAGTVLLTALEPITLTEALFEVCSAAGTVGLTKGITPLLGNASKILLMILMFGGRVGGLTLILVFWEGKPHVNAPLKRPKERILIG
ncbi:MAG: TrkH family potassium uptake protein [Firmicutes bacterium]|nr:TrkH family potassium uptake protein [Bacillota bacterium]